tara:strand:- start:10707 stop:11039 length:333 start_codon:yes stop_codon:yes gene_type:complete
LPIIFYINLLKTVLADTVKFDCNEREQLSRESSKKNSNKTMTVIFKGNKAFIKGMILNCKLTEKSIFCEKKSLNDIWELKFHITQKKIQYYTYNTINNSTRTFSGICKPS